MSANDTHHLESFDAGQFFSEAKHRRCGAAGHVMPALLQGISDTHVVHPAPFWGLVAAIQRRNKLPQRCLVITKWGQASRSPHRIIENAVRWPGRRPRWMKVCSSDRCDHRRILTRCCNDLLHKFKPTHCPRIREMVHSGASVEGELAKGGCQISRKRRTSPLVVDKRKRVSLTDQSKHGCHHV